MIKREWNFYIYENGTFKNKDKLNSIGVELYEWLLRFFRALNTDARTVQECKDSIKILVTSQDYNGRGSRRTGRHGHGNAIDLQIQPIQWNPVFWIILHRYHNYNLALSLHNRHLHIDAAWRHNSQYPQNEKVWELRRQNDPYNVFDFVPCSENYLEALPDHYYAVDRRKTEAMYAGDPSGMLRRYNRTVRLNEPCFAKYEMTNAQYIPNLSDIANLRLWNYQGLCKTFTKEFYTERITEKERLAESVTELVSNTVSDMLPEWFLPALVGIGGIALLSLLKSNAPEVKVYVEKENRHH